jgi:hypothetical protein
MHVFPVLRLNNRTIISLLPDSPVMSEGEVVQGPCEATLVVVVATTQENEEEICLC